MAEGGVEQSGTAYKETTARDVSNDISGVSDALTSDATEVLNTRDSSRGILWIDVLPGNRIILLRSDEPGGASQLSLYDDNKLLSELDLPDDKCVSVDILNGHQLIVPVFQTKQLLIVNIDGDKLTNGPVIIPDVTPLLILKYSDSSVLVFAGDEDDDMCFAILNLTGNVEKHVKVDADLVAPMFMKMSPERNVVYILDHENGCFGFNLEGDVIFNYNDSDCNVYVGLAVDLVGAVYFSAKKDSSLSCMTKLTPAGQMLGHIDREMYPVQCIGNKLYGCGYSDQHELVIMCITV